MPIYEKGSVVKYEANGGIRAAILLDSLLRPKDHVDLLVGKRIITCTFNKRKQSFSKYIHPDWSLIEAKPLPGKELNMLLR